MAVPELPSRRDVIERTRQRGGRAMAVLPYHYPRALLRAHGFHPVELWETLDAARPGFRGPLWMLRQSSLTGRN